MQLVDESVLQISFVWFRNGGRLIAMDDYNRRICPAGIGISQFDPTTVYQGRRVLGDRLVKNFVELAGFDLLGGGRIGSPDGWIQFAYARAVQRRDKV